ncbi:ATP-dependent carboxylate-amine ligase [Brevundimonas sp.]|uniref:ATP-dependent carboxylate-amine ligase n=1 Tax=Brevundimonas sp. TaxID=1871086 RepID=UPI0035B13DAE
MPERILVTGARAPAALDIARSLKAAGFEVHMADCVPARMARWSSAATAVHRHASPVHRPAKFAQDIRRLIDRIDPIAVIPTCEEVFHLAAVAKTDGWSEKLIAPPFETLATLHHKGRFAVLCDELGLPVPDTNVVTDSVGLMREALGADVVVKPAWSRFGSQALIKPDAAALERLRPSPEAPWVVQSRVEGEEVSFYAIAHDGILTAFSAYRSDWRTHGGAAYVFIPLAEPVFERLRAMAQTLARFVRKGQFACDAIVDEACRPWLIECNPRATSGVHLFGRSAALGRALLGRDIARPSPGRWRNGIMLDTFGLGDALRAKRLTAWRDERRLSHDILSAPRDPLPPLGALLDAAGFGLRALASGHGLAEAMTADIEWNGQPLTPALWERP